MKFLLPLIAYISAFCATPSAPVSGQLVQYIKFGTGIIFQKNSDRLHSLAVGVGVRSVNETHCHDICTTHYSHPGYSILACDMSYLFSPEYLCGAYIGVGGRVGISTFEYPVNYADGLYHSYDTKVFYNAPITVGYAFASPDLGNRYRFVQAQFTWSRFVTVSSGFGF